MHQPPTHPVAVTAGGLVGLTYINALGTVTDLWLYVAHFRVVPGTPFDYPYNLENCVDVAEATLGDTLNHFSALWSAYMPQSFALVLARLDQLKGVATRDADGNPTVEYHLEPVPLQGPYGLRSGQLSDPAPGAPLSARMFDFFSEKSGAPHRITLNGVPEAPHGYDGFLNDTTGGIDQRDRDLVAYVAGQETGIVAADCARFNEPPHAPWGMLRDWVAF